MVSHATLNVMRHVYSRNRVSLRLTLWSFCHPIIPKTFSRYFFNKVMSDSLPPTSAPRYSGSTSGSTGFQTSSTGSNSHYVLFDPSSQSGSVFVSSRSPNPVPDSTVPTPESMHSFRNDIPHSIIWIKYYIAFLSYFSIILGSGNNSNI